MALPPPDAGVAVVSGAASGIGAAMTRRLARSGYEVFAIDRDVPMLVRMADALAPARVVPRGCDLTDRGQRADLAGELSGMRIAVLCNNAGIGTFGRFAATRPQLLGEQVELDVVAVQDLLLAVLAGMLAARSGAILMVGSIAGNQPVPGGATYAAAKAFVNSLSEALTAELRGTGVTCTLLAPGPVHSGFGARAGVKHAERRIPRAAWLTSDEAAAAGLAALSRGTRRVTPGVVARLLDVAGRVAAHSLLLPAVRHLIDRYAGEAPPATARAGAVPAERPR